MKVLGLTGDIACGKSTVARWLQERGAAVLDSDLLVRELYADASFAAQLQTLFAAPIRDENGGVDRARLGALVFADARKLRELETRVHPAVARLRDAKLRELAAQGRRAVVIEAVKLLESGGGNGCDAVWCVICAPDIQLARLMRDRGLSEDAARARLQHQPTRDAKAALAGQTPLCWIENNGTPDELAALVARQWTRFLA